MAKSKKADPDEPPAGTGAAVTKAEAVRRAILAGFDVPVEGVAWVKAMYGLDIGTQMFSSYKSAARRAGASSGIKVGGRGRTGGGDVLEVAKQVKQLVDKHGVGTVTECLELFR